MSEQKNQKQQQPKRKMCPYCGRVDFKSHRQYAGHISAHIRSRSQATCQMHPSPTSPDMEKRAKLLSILDNALKPSIDTLKEKPMDALGVLSDMSSLPQEKRDKIVAILEQVKTGFGTPNLAALLSLPQEKRDKIASIFAETIKVTIKVSVRWFDGYLEEYEASEVRFGSGLLWMRLKNGENRHIPTRQVRWWSMYPESHERRV